MLQREIILAQAKTALRDPDSLADRMAALERNRVRQYRFLFLKAERELVRQQKFLNEARQYLEKLDA